MHTSPKRSSWHIFCLGNHACKWLSGRCVRCAFAPCFACTQSYSWQMQPFYAKQHLCQEFPSQFFLRHQGGRWFLPLQLIFLCFKAVPAACVPNCSPYFHTPASAETECQSCFVASGAAHNSRSTAGTPSALHQQHLTPAQQATQAAITAPATHQDGKVPVRTGLAWAALGTPFPSFSCMAEISQPPRLHCVWCSNAWAAVGAILPFVRLSYDCRGPFRPLSSLRQSCSTTLFCVTQLAPYKTAVL